MLAAFPKNLVGALILLIFDYIEQEMTEGLKLRTLQWKFAGSIEPPRVISCRTEQTMGKDNMFGQVTVRFHTQQVSSSLFLVFLVFIWLS